ncbi:MAG: RNA polymerase sigma factor [Dehalococcoidia bacterium]
MPTFEDDWARDATGAVSEGGENDVLAALAARAARGERQAFAEIYSLLAGDVYGFVRSQAATDEAAEDLVAETFLRAWKYARRFRANAGDYRAWIFTIAKNQVRSQGRKARIATQPLETVEGVFAGKALLEVSAVSVALSRLRPNQRTIIALHYYSGCTLREIADILGKKEGSIRRTLLRALTRLREELDEAAPNGAWE